MLIENLRNGESSFCSPWLVRADQPMDIDIMDIREFQASSACDPLSFKGATMVFHDVGAELLEPDGGIGKDVAADFGTGVEIVVSTFAQHLGGHPELFRFFNGIDLLPGALDAMAPSVADEIARQCDWWIPEHRYYRQLSSLPTSIGALRGVFGQARG